MGQIAPNLNAHPVQGSLAVQRLLMKFAAREYEREEESADIRFAVKRQSARAVRAACPGYRQPMQNSARAQLVTAAATKDTSLTISALNTANAELRRHLIALQIHVEDAGDRAAQRQIWDALNTMASRGVVSLFWGDRGMKKISQRRRRRREVGPVVPGRNGVGRRCGGGGWLYVVKEEGTTSAGYAPAQSHPRIGEIFLL